jgi:predicted metalloprotease with PDZ domain
MRYLPVVVLALSVFTISSAVMAGETGPVQYRLAPVLHEGRLEALTVEMRFPADADGSTELDLPDRYGGGQGYYKALTGLNVEGADSVEMPEPAVRIIHSRPGAELSVRYRIGTNLAAGRYPAGERAVYPAISPDFFHILGPTLFAQVDGRSDAMAVFRWGGGRGWTLASEIDPSPANLTQMDVVRSVVMGGRHLRVTRVKTPYTDLRVASLGTFRFDLKELDTAIARVIATEQAFWSDGQKTYFVAVMPVAESGQFLRGTGLRNAFDLMTTPEIQEGMLKITLAHEYFHSWNPGAVGGAEPNSAEGYWFSEGFTDYYGRRMALKAGVIDLAGFADAWNRVLNSYASSPLRASPNVEIARNFWSDPDAMTYSRGSILAAYWNRKWRPQGLTVDRLMYTLRELARSDPDFGKKPFTERVEAAGVRLGVSLSGDLKRYVIDGEPLSLPADAFGSCLTVLTEDAPVFELGYDREKSAAAGIIAGVVPDSNAWRAGLRDGMERLAVLGGEPGDATVPIRFKVRTPEGQERALRSSTRGSRRGAFSGQACRMRGRG